MTQKTSKAYDWPITQSFVDSLTWDEALLHIPSNRSLAYIKINDTTNPDRGYLLGMKITDKGKKTYFVQHLSNNGNRYPLGLCSNLSWKEAEQLGMEYRSGRRTVEEIDRIRRDYRLDEPTVVDDPQLKQDDFSGIDYIYNVEKGKHQYTTSRRQIRQAVFRRMALERYHGHCILTDESDEHILEAAHIRDHDGNNTDVPANSLLLRADRHAAFDKGLICIDPAFCVHVSPKVKNTSSLWDHHGQTLILPPDTCWALNWHWQKFAKSAGISNV